ncbi:AI-2E family transporter [Sinanaerobacter chloroacetimidivorans]|uniref:AI-2E family transporter n=1 Tax=Sinanaerobacter chloroacetimidivorans TaxID=2818044 RepID=A0A8J7W4A5_9FIRM|nr:AI-2E family transporter [Sinanaerobacter chloroacetimidivorans]MBR0598816.1 AI-2E family transporter [Sinanaerobacter chloroacetimidivorans]
MTDCNDNQRGRGTKEIIISLVVLFLMFVTIGYMLDIVLLTFIITFIFYHLVKKIQNKARLAGLRVPDGVVLSILYILFILVLAFASIEFAPILATQFTDLANIFIRFDINAVRDSLDPRLAEAIDHIDFNKYITEAGVMLATGITKIGGFGVSLFLSMILGFFLLLEKNKIKKFGEILGQSRVSYIYEYLIVFGGNFVQTFGKVMKVQITIALINSILSMILLTFLQFPQIMSLGVMIFLLGLIPVAGVIISLVPLSIIAFNIGGISKVIAVIIMIVLIHTVEAYILNPKLMSDKTELPVCFVFIILLVGEHYLGVWGLLIGVPIFIFLMNALQVEFEGANKKERVKVKKIKGSSEEREEEC